VTSNRMPLQPADIALRRALEQQAAALVPIAAGLQAAVAHPPIAPADWHGPASEAYEGLERRLRSRLRVAERAVSTTLQTTRIALADLGG
jgi:hypothetical protein